MDIIVYSLKKKKETDEFHLFETIMSKDNKECTPRPKSICKEMVLSETESTKFACHDEKGARKECAEIGRPVCGTCVSHLYATYK